MSAAGQSICFFYFTLNEGKIASYCLALIFGNTVRLEFVTHNFVAHSLALDKFIVEAYFKPYRGSFYKISRGGGYAKKYDT